MQRESFAQNFIAGFQQGQRLKESKEQEEWQREARKLQEDQMRLRLQRMKQEDQARDLLARQQSTQARIGQDLPGMMQAMNTERMVNELRPRYVPYAGEDMPTPTGPGAPRVDYTTGMNREYSMPLPDGTTLETTLLQQARNQEAARIQEAESVANAEYMKSRMQKLGEVSATPTIPMETSTGTFNLPVGDAADILLKREDAALQAIRDQNQHELAMSLQGVKDEAAMRRAQVAASATSDRYALGKMESIAKTFDANPIVKQFAETQNKYQSVQGIIDSGVGGPGDLALVFEFMKALDPDSVVRESEYESAAKSGNIFKGAYARFNGYLKAEGGFLPPEVKESFMKITKLKMEVAREQYRNLRAEYGQRINTQTGRSDGEQQLVDYEGAFSGIPTVGGSFNGERVVNIERVE